MDIYFVSHTIFGTDGCVTISTTQLNGAETYILSHVSN
jgi:hypothetical protein